MLNRALRFLLRPINIFSGSGLLVLSFLPMWGMATETIVAAKYTGPTERYPHAILGDAVEHETLTVTLLSGIVRRFTLPGNAVFEDTAPRLADLDGDGHPEVLTVESDQQRGARLAIFGAEGRITATPHIGTRFRWLAPLGAADLDGDGRVEVAYVDRPHLAKILRIWRFEDGSLSPVAAYTGVTNHRIGETDIAGGIRDCGAGPEMILADSQWTRLLALRFERGNVLEHEIGEDTTRVTFRAALNCEIGT